MDLALVSVVGVVDGQATTKSPGKSVTKKDKNKKRVASHAKTVKSSGSKPAKSRLKLWTRIGWKALTDLEALLLARTLEKSQPELTFHTVKVLPTSTPTVGAVKLTEPFIQPVDQPQSASHVHVDLL